MITNAKEAAAELQKGIDGYKERYAHPSFQFIINKDIQRLEEIRDNLEEGRIQAAWDSAYFLDTLVREEGIGPKVWDWFTSTGLIAEYHGK